VISAATSTSSITSPVSEANSTLTPAGADDRLRRDADPLQREQDEAEADQDAAEAADARRLAREEQDDAQKIRSGASHDMSNDSTTVTIDVPTSAPSMTASALAVVMIPWPANAATISAVAVELWIRPVTPMPGR
jgi:hypothetical protein